MGDPRKIKNKFKAPSHPWQKVRIEEESILLKEFGLKNKSEIWRANSWLAKYSDNAKKLITAKNKQAEIEKEQMLTKLKGFGLLPENATVADVLGITVKDVLERRLQSIVFRKNMARSMKQARQFITHEHIFVGQKKISVPSYMITLKEEATIAFDADSPFTDDMHPERTPIERKEEKKEEKKVEKKHDKRHDKRPAKKKQENKAPPKEDKK